LTQAPVQAHSGRTNNNVMGLKVKFRKSLSQFNFSVAQTNS